MFHRSGLMLCALLVLVCCVVAHAQQVSGLVRATDTGQPLYNAVVHCEGVGTSQIQQTDRNGRFTCLLAASGSFKVRVALPGYTEEEQSSNAADTNVSQYMFFKLNPSPVARVTQAPAVDPNVPAEARTEYAKGVEAVNAGSKQKLEEAVRHFEKAIKIEPKFLQAQIALGTAYMDLELWENAERVLNKTLELDPAAANAMFALGEIYLRQKRNDEAEKLLLQGLKLDAKSFQGHLALSRLYWDAASKIEDETKARPLLEKSYEAVKKALELNPNVAAAHLLKGNLLLRVRRAADAQHEFEEYLRLEPKGQFAAQASALVQKIKKALEEQKKQ